MERKGRRSNMAVGYAKEILSFVCVRKGRRWLLVVWISPVAIVMVVFGRSKEMVVERVTGRRSGLN